MYTFRQYCIAALLLTGILFFSGCLAPDFFLSGKTGTDDIIRIAAVLPLSGKNRVFAEQMREGLQMAVHELNANSRNGKKAVILRTFDSKGSADGTAAALKEVKKWNAAGIIAGYSTDEVSSIIANAANLRMPIVMPLATSDRHSEISPYVYRTCYTNSQQAEMLAAYLWYWRTAKHLGIFTGENEEAEYQTAITRGTAESFQTLGGSITTVISLPGELSDKDVSAMLKSDPEAILLTFGGKKAALAIRKLRSLGFTGIICGADNWNTAELIDALDNFKVGDCLYTALFADDDSVAEYRNFKTAFRKRFYHNPGACETQCYDALKFLVFSLRNTGTLPGFDKNWRKIRNLHGAAACYTMLPKGGIDRTIYINSIGVRRNGQKIEPFARLSKKLQYSKLQEYKPEYYE